VERFSEERNVCAAPPVPASSKSLVENVSEQPLADACDSVSIAENVSALLNHNREGAVENVSALRNHDREGVEGNVSPEQPLADACEFVIIEAQPLVDACGSVSVAEPVSALRSHDREGVEENVFQPTVELPPVPDAVAESTPEEESGMEELDQDGLEPELDTSIEIIREDEEDSEPEAAATGETPAEQTPAEQLPLETVPPMDDKELWALLEAIVYVTEEPVTPEQIATALAQPLDRVKSVLDDLVSEYNGPVHGVMIREVAGGYKMATKPEHHEAIRAFVKSLKAPFKLSLPALETLATIAYKQPVTAPEIMEIRGVQGAGVLKTLLDRKLIQTSGRKNVVGKPILYKTTKDFLVQFGLKDLTELPTLKEFEELRRMAIDSEPEDGSNGPDLAAEPETTDASDTAEFETEAESSEPNAIVEPEQAEAAASESAPDGTPTVREGLQEDAQPSGQAASTNAEPPQSQDAAVSAPSEGAEQKEPNA